MNADRWHHRTMCAMRRSAAQVLGSLQLARAARAVLCLAAVLLAHGLLWLSLWPGSAPIGERVVAVQVRQLIVPARAAAVADAQPAQVAPSSNVARVQRKRIATSLRDDSIVGVTAPQTGAAPAPDAAGASESIAAATPSGVSPLQTYHTRIPSSTLLTFTLQRGSELGEANLHWQVQGDRYVLQLQALMPQGRVVEQRSQGGFDEAGLAPLRLADQRRGRDVRAANFQREHRKISFSGPRWEWPLYGGAQDRLSWLVQLVAIASAAPDAIHEGAELSMWVASTRGALGIWRFEVHGRQPVAAPSGEALAWWLVREPAFPYDLRIEVWLDPGREHWPLKLRQTQVPGGQPLEWTLRDEPRSPPGG
jgi:Protein of unknown function (DUF3108)